MKRRYIIPETTFRRAGGESGQVIFLVAIFLIAMLAMTGLVVDGGGLYFLQRDAQNAVDAAAIAATYELCREGGERATAENRAINTLAAHNFDTSQEGVVVAITTPDEAGMNDPASYIKIELTAPKDNYFIRVVDDSDLLVTVSAIGQCNRNDSNYANSAIVGVGHDCSRATVNVTGSFNQTLSNGEKGYVDGITSNGVTNTKGSNNSPMDIRGNYVVPDRDSIQGVSNNNGVEYIPGVMINGYGPGDPEQLGQVNQAGVQTFETLYHIDWFNPNSTQFQQIEANPDASVWGSEAVRIVEAVRDAVDAGKYQQINGGHVNWDLDQETAEQWGGNQPWIIKEGIVYVRGDFGTSGGNFGSVEGAFTLVTEGRINISGPRWSFGEAYVKPITMFSWHGATASNADPSQPGYDPNANGDCNNGINISSANTTFNGLIYAPFGHVNISMSSTEAPLYGQVIGYNVNVSVSSAQFRFQNDFLPAAPPTLGLIQ